MLTRNQFLFMLLLAIIGTAFAYYVQKLVHWSNALEWIKKIHLYEFLGAVAIVIAFILVMWANEAICKRIKDRAERDEHKEKVANSLRSRQPVDVE